MSKSELSWGKMFSVLAFVVGLGSAALACASSDEGSGSGDSASQTEETSGQPSESDARAAGEATPTNPCPFQFKKVGLCASLTWEKAPEVFVDSPFVLRFWDEKTGKADGPYVTPAYTVFPYLWMPDHGHGSRRIVVSALESELGKALEGEFRCSKVHFSMPGRWQLFVQLKDADQKVVDSVVLDPIDPKESE